MAKVRTTVQGQTAIARIIADTFGIKFTKQYVVRYQSRQADPFPKPNPTNNDFNVADCLAWAKRHVEKNGTGEDKAANLMQMAADAVARKKIRMDLEHSFDFEVKQGLYVLRREAEIQAIGLAKRFLAITRDEIRARMLKVNVNLGEEIIDALDAKYQEAANE